MSTDSDADVQRSKAFSLANRLLFPGLCVALSVVYVVETAGMTIRSLRYPYFVIGLMGFLIATVVVEEVLAVHRTDRSSSMLASIRAFYDDWRLSIFVGVGAIAFLVLIDWLGFLVSSFVVMVVMMYGAGERDPKTVIGVTTVVLVAIYLVFTVLIGLDLPEGPLGLI